MLIYRRVILSLIGLIYGVLAFSASAVAVTDCPVAQVIGGTRSDEWMVYGAKIQHARTANPTGMHVLSVAARAGNGVPWSSAASVPVPHKVRAGETVTAVFWARAERPTKIPALMHATTTPYPQFTRMDVALTPAWQRFVLQGQADADFDAGSRSFSLHLGRAGTQVQLGRLILFCGKPAETDIASALAAAEPGIEDLSFSAPDGKRLEGTLRLPGGPGPFPVVVTIGGSAAQPRGGFQAVNRPLVAKGIATFEYDKRGSGASAGPPIDTISVLSGDLKAAVAALRKRADVDGARIALAGSSKGGVVVSAAADDDPAIRAVVMLAGPALSGEALFMSQVVPQMKAITPEPALQERRTELVKQILPVLRDTADDKVRRQMLQKILKDAARRGVVPSKIVAPLVSNFADPSLHELLTEQPKFQPEAVLRRLGMPVLALYAENDALVRSQENLPVAQRALCNNPNATVKEIEGVDHLFRPGRTTLDDTGKSTGAPFGAPAMVDVIVPWLSGHLLSNTALVRVTSGTGCKGGLHGQPPQPATSVR